MTVSFLHKRCGYMISIDPVKTFSMDRGSFILKKFDNTESRYPRYSYELKEVASDG